MSKFCDFTMVRQVIDKDGTGWGFQFYKKSALPDLTGYVCLGVRKDDMEEWVPERQYKGWKRIFDKNHGDSNDDL
jgi:hypothetical protein